MTICLPLDHLARYLDENLGGENGNEVCDEEVAKHFSDLKIPEGQQWCINDNSGAWRTYCAPFARLISCKSSYSEDGERLFFDVTIEVPDRVRVALIAEDNIGEQASTSIDSSFAPNTNDIVKDINDIVAERKVIKR